MARTITALHPASRVRGLLVEVHGDTDPSRLRAITGGLIRRLYDRGIRVGLIVTPTATYVVRDHVTGLGFAENRFTTSAPIPTASLLQAVGDAPPSTNEQELTRQIKHWMTAVAASWASFLPSDAIPIMVPDVVGQLAQADYEEWDDVLEPGDAVA